MTPNLVSRSVNMNSITLYPGFRAQSTESGYATRDIRRVGEIERFGNEVAYDFELHYGSEHQTFRQYPVHVPERRDISNVTFHFVRHAQAAHNIRQPKPSLKRSVVDPPLTEHGINQCNFIAESFPYIDDINYVLCSPLSRCISTTLIGFAPVLENGAIAIAWNDLREFGVGPNNIGSPLSSLKKQLAGIPVSLELLYPGWEMPDENSYLVQDMRVDRVTRDLYALARTALDGGVWKGISVAAHLGPGNVNILIVSHGGFLSTLLGFDHQCFRNTQVRSFVFPSAKSVQHDFDPLHLIETQASRARKHVAIIEPSVPTAPTPPNTPVSSPRPATTVTPPVSPPRRVATPVLRPSTPPPVTPRRPRTPPRRPSTPPLPITPIYPPHTPPPLPPCPPNTPASEYGSISPLAHFDDVSSTRAFSGDDDTSSVCSSIRSFRAIVGEWDEEAEGVCEEKLDGKVIGLGAGFEGKSGLTKEALEEHYKKVGDVKKFGHLEKTVGYLSRWI